MTLRYICICWLCYVQVGETVLMKACEGKASLEVVELLISHGADIYSITRVSILYVVYRCDIL